MRHWAPTAIGCSPASSPERFAQLALGAAVGMLGAFALEQVLEGEMFQGRGAIILPAVALVMTTVGVLAAIGPARQGLSIQPTEALREE